MPPKTRNPSTKNPRKAKTERKPSNKTKSEQNGHRKNAKVKNQEYVMEALDNAMSQMSGAPGGAAFTADGLTFVAVGSAASASEGNRTMSGDPLGLDQANSLDDSNEDIVESSQPPLPVFSFRPSANSSAKSSSSSAKAVKEVHRSLQPWKRTTEQVLNDFEERFDPNLSNRRNATIDFLDSQAHSQPLQRTPVMPVSRPVNDFEEDYFDEWGKRKSTTFVMKRPFARVANAVHTKQRIESRPSGRPAVHHVNDSGRPEDIVNDSTTNAEPRSVSAVSMAREQEAIDEPDNDFEERFNPNHSNRRNVAIDFQDPQVHSQPLQQTPVMPVSRPVNDFEEDYFDEWGKRKSTVFGTKHPFARVANAVHTKQRIETRPSERLSLNCLAVHDVNDSGRPENIVNHSTTNAELCTAPAVSMAGVQEDIDEPGNEDDEDSYRNKYINLLEMYNKQASAHKELKRKLVKQQTTIAELKDLVIFANRETKKALEDPDAKLTFTVDPDIDMTIDQVKEIDSASKSDTAFGQNLALFFYGARKLQTMSVCGISTNRIKNSTPRPGISPKKLAFIHEKVHQRVASRVGANNFAQIATLAHPTRINKAIAEKIANLVKASRNALARDVIRDANAAAKPQEDHMQD